MTRPGRGYSTDFDAYVAVDWSANSTPKTGMDSIWVAWGRWDRGTFTVGNLANPRTRGGAMALITETLTSLVAGGARVLVGFDFAYGYPSGMAKALALPKTNPGWLAVWDELGRLVADQASNANNRFQVANALNNRLGPPGPFWACPSSAATASLCTRKGAYPHRTSTGAPLAEYRVVEQHLRSSGRMVHSTWKLFTRGSVGSQALLGIPHLARLVSEPSLRGRSSVWPFETGFQIPTAPTRPGVVHVEIWPGLFDVDLGRHQTPDAAQVLSVILDLADKDHKGSLASLFAPTTVPPAQVLACQTEEGWIFGA